MSQYEHIKGKIKLVDIQGISLEDTCMMALQREGIDPDPEYDPEQPYEMQIWDECYHKFVVYDDNLYEVLDSEYVGDYDIYNASMNADGTISFEVCFYSGGCSMEEAVGEALDRMNKK